MMYRSTLMGVIMHMRSVGKANTDKAVIAEIYLKKAVVPAPLNSVGWGWRFHLDQYINFDIHWHLDQYIKAVYRQYTDIYKIILN